METDPNGGTFRHGSKLVKQVGKLELPKGPFWILCELSFAYTKCTLYCCYPKRPSAFAKKSFLPPANHKNRWTKWHTAAWPLLLEQSNLQLSSYFRDMKKCKAINLSLYCRLQSLAKSKQKTSNPKNSTASGGMLTALTDYLMSKPSPWHWRTLCLYCRLEESH